MDLSTRASVELFRKEAASFTVKATRSKNEALAVLISEGMYTKTGALAKAYCQAVHRLNRGTSKDHSIGSHRRRIFL